MSNISFAELNENLKKYYTNTEEAQKIIKTCALTAASADAIGGFIPGLAVPATIVACFGTVWVMYGKLANTLGIKLKENVLKLLARAVLANIAANLGGAMAASLIGLVIPGASIAVSAVITYVTIYLAGFVFLQLVVKLASQSSNPSTFEDISEKQMKAAVKETRVTRDDLDAAKATFQNVHTLRRSTMM